MNELFLDLLINKKKKRNSSVNSPDPLEKKLKILFEISNYIIKNIDHIPHFNRFTKLYKEFSEDFMEEYINIENCRAIIVVILLKMVTTRTFPCTAIIPLNLVAVVDEGEKYVEE